MWLKKVVNYFFGEDELFEKKGKVKFFNCKCGYGFIEFENMDRDVFVYVISLEDKILKGDEVVFEVEVSDKGFEVCKVWLIQYLVV